MISFLFLLAVNVLPAAQPSQISREINGIEMVYVPGGPFLFGTAEGEGLSDEFPEQTVPCGSFWISRHEITGVQYWPFFVQLASRYKDWKDDNSIPFGQEPMRGMAYDEALEFTSWLSEQSGREYRLPTEIQWEKASRGTDGRRFPWGNEPPSETRAAYYHGPGSPLNPLKAEVVCNYPQGVSPFGCFDMAGNVAEWVIPIPDQTIREVLHAAYVRGGSFDDEGRVLRCSNRIFSLEKSPGIFVGIRVVRLPDAEDP